MTRDRITFVKLISFAIATITLTALLFSVFAQYRSGPTQGYSAVFRDVSQLRPGDSVRVAGIRVGTVHDVNLQGDKTVIVDFDAENGVALTVASRAEVRYLNLVGDRYLELTEGTGSTQILPRGAQIPVDRTSGALDLDQLLGGLKPVIKGLNPQEINALTASIVEILQGQGGTLDSLMARTTSFTNTLADNGAVVQQLIDNLNTVLQTLNHDGKQFSDTIDRLEKLITGLSKDRDPIGDAIVSLDRGTASITDLLTQARPPLAGTVDQLNRLAPLLDDDKSRIESALQKAPDNYRKLIRPVAYGSFFNLYLCGATIRVSDLSGGTAVFPWIRQSGGRCSEP
jgi:phospholipid/cholesterol/gamma-HCH transport system substrate-binding protein